MMLEMMQLIMGLILLIEQCQICLLYLVNLNVVGYEMGSQRCQRDNGVGIANQVVEKTVYDGDVVEVAVGPT